MREIINFSWIAEIPGQSLAGSQPAYSQSSAYGADLQHKWPESIFL